MKRQGSRPSPISSGALGTLLALLIALSAASAGAQSEGDKKRAQSLQLEGVQLLERGDNRAALRKFEEAIRIFPSPKIRFNIGRAHAALGDDVEALNDFERFLDEAPYAPKQSRDEAQRIVETLRPKLSYLDIATDDVGARVSVDGKEIGVVPLGRPLATTPGAHQVRLEKPDMIAETREVSPVAGQKVRVFFKLRPVAAPAGEARPTPLAARPTSPAVAGDEGEARPPGRPRAQDASSPEATATRPAPIREPEAVAPASAGSSSGRRALKWIAWGAAAAGAGLGTYGFLSNHSKVDEFNKWCGFDQNGMVTPDPKVEPNSHTAPQCTALRNDYESATKLAVGGFIGAGVLAALGFVFWATETDAPPTNQRESARLSCVPALTPALEPSVTCALRF